MSLRSSNTIRRLVLAAALLLIGVAAVVTYPRWQPIWEGSLARINPAWGESAASHNDHRQNEDHGHDDRDHDDHGDDGHDGHEDDHGEDAARFLTLSEPARRNLGLTSENLRRVEKSTFRRSIRLPATVVERPGRTQLRVAAPLTGVVTHVHAVPGEAVLPGTLLFELRLTHEDLVNTQTEFLKTLGEWAVEQREVARLEKVATTGAISGKMLLEKEYVVEILEAQIKAQREALRLHGLSEAQIDGIATERRLLRDLHVIAPSPDEHDHETELRLTGEAVQPVTYSEAAAAPPPLIVDELSVHKGQAVSAGENLATLADYSRLYIEAYAFEQDSGWISNALKRGWTVSAEFSDGVHDRLVENLQPAFLANAVDRESRTLSLFVDLPNEKLRDQTSEDGQRFISWRYRPGQRLQLHVPVEEWSGQFVVPIEAVVREGAEWYVFRQNGSRFERLPVNVRYRNRQSAVIADDGSISELDRLALKGAHQMQMALKSAQGGTAQQAHGHTH